MGLNGLCESHIYACARASVSASMWMYAHRGKIRTYVSLPIMMFRGTICSQSNDSIRSIKVNNKLITRITQAMCVCLQQSARVRLNTNWLYTPCSQSVFVHTKLFLDTLCPSVITFSPSLIITSAVVMFISWLINWFWLFSSVFT